MSVILALTFAFVVTLLLARGSEGRERRIVWLALLARLAGTGGLLAFHGSRGSDMDGYGPHGMAIAELMREDFGRWFPEVINAALHRETILPVVPGSTGAMDALSGLAFLLVGDSLPAACLFVSTLVLIGEVLLYRLLASHVASGDRVLVAIGCFFVPSVAFWTGGLVKEAFALAGTGLIVDALHGVFERRRLLRIFSGVLGALLITTKPYVLFPLALAVGAWIFAARRGRIRPVYLVVGAAVALAGVAVLGSLFPDYGLEHLGDTLSVQRRNSEMAGGGSGLTFEEDDRLEVRDVSLAGQFKFLPLALLNALARPFLFEVRNIPQLAAALEATVIVVVVASLLWRVKVKELFIEVTSSPLLLASAVFVLTFAAAVGLASTNLGTISRYRVPLVPFYISMVLLLRRRFGDQRDAVRRGPTARRPPISIAHAAARSRRMVARRNP